MLIAQEEIVKQAQEKAADIIAQAQMAAKEIRRASHEFSDSILKQTEENLSASLKNVRDTRPRCAAQPAKQNRCRFQRRVNPSGTKSSLFAPQKPGTKMAAFLLNTEKGKRYEHNDVKMGGPGADAAGPPGGIFSAERSAVVPVAGQDERAAVFVLSGAGAGKDPEPPALSQKAVDRLGGDGAGQFCTDPAVPAGAGGDQQQYFFHHGGSSPALSGSMRASTAQVPAGIT